LRGLFNRRNNMKIKSNEKIFNEWKQLGMKISMLSSIVQNDMEISTEEYLEWINLAYKSISNMNKLIEETKKIIQ
jgi:3-methyladenine DNA glycosylase AlkD